MKLSINLPVDHIQYGDEFIGQDALTDLARTAEAAGFEACAVTDHPVPGVAWLDSGGHYAQDPFVMLGMIAAVTQHIKVQTFLLILPYRNPFLMARAIASLDISSNGRVIMAVGAGYLKAEFEALGVDFDTRNDASDEALRAMVTAWTQDEFTFEGTGYRASGNRILPRPAQQPHPPIWAGGNSQRAIRRAVDYCQGWVPFHAPGKSAQRTRTAEIASIDDYSDRLDYLRTYAAQAGKPVPEHLAAPEFVRWREEEDNGAYIDNLKRCAELGANWSVVNIPGITRAAWRDNVHRFMDQIRPAL